MFKAHRIQHLCKTFLPVIAQLWIVALLVSITHAAPAVSTGLLAEGTVWQTRYYIMDSNIEGPTVLITGGDRPHFDIVAGAAGLE